MGRYFFWIKIGVAVGLLALLFWKIDWRQTLATLIDAQPGAIAAATAMSVLAILISALRWKILLNARSLDVTTLQSIRSYWMGSFASNYLPTNVGGDIVRVASLHRLNQMAEIAASVLVDRINGLAVLLCICVVILAIGPPNVTDTGLLLAFWAGVLSLVAIVLAVILMPQVALYPFRYKPLLRFKIVHSVGRKVTKLVDAFRHYRRHKIALCWSTAGSLFFYFCVVVVQFYCLEAVNAGVSFTDVLLIAPLLPLVGLLPISLNGLGLIEGAFVAFYVAAGAPPTTALAAAVIRRVVTTGTSAIGAVFWLGDGPSRPS